MLEQKKQMVEQTKRIEEQGKQMLEQGKQIEEHKKKGEAALASSQEMGRQLATLQGVVERERQATRGSQAMLRTQSVQLSTLRSELGRNTQQQNLELCTYLVRLGVRLPQWVECEIVAAVEAKVIQSGDTSLQMCLRTPWFARLRPDGLRHPLPGHPYRSHPSQHGKHT